MKEPNESDPTPKKKQVLTLLDQDTFERVQRLAEKEDRPLSAAVRRLVVEALDAREQGAAA